jgi:hypothetical protein
MGDEIGGPKAARAACEVVLHLLRAKNPDRPHAFALEEQSYVRLLDGGAGRAARFPWADDVIARLGAIQREKADPVAAAWPWSPASTRCVSGLPDGSWCSSSRWTRARASTGGAASRSTICGAGRPPRRRSSTR